MLVDRRQLQRTPALRQPLRPPAPLPPALHEPAPPAFEPPAAQDAIHDTPLARTLARAVQQRTAPVANVLQRVDGDDAEPVPLPAATAQTVQILYTSDHATRAIALQGELPEARGGLVTGEPAAIPGLTTLVFWGHGDAHKLCNLTPAAAVTLVKRWKVLNPSLQTVELITCNARHYAPGKGKGDSFANKLKSGLGGFRSSTRNLTVKALPTTLTGSKNAFSILLAEAPTKSWVYVTGPGATDKVMMQGSSLITYERKPDGGLKSFRGDIAERADKVIRQNPEREWTMLYGYFRDLRRVLNVVKA